MYHFDDGYNLAKATFVEIHAGPDAKEIKKVPVADHDKVRIMIQFHDSLFANSTLFAISSTRAGAASSSGHLQAYFLAQVCCKIENRLVVAFELIYHVEFTGETSATLLDANDHVICRSK